MRKLHQTKTAKYNVIMGCLQVLNANLFLFEAVADPKTFAIIALVIGLAHSFGAMWIRLITEGKVEL